MIERGTTGLVLTVRVSCNSRREQACAVALQRKLPPIGSGRPYPEADCLLSYASTPSRLVSTVTNNLPPRLSAARTSLILRGLPFASNQRVEIGRVAKPG